MNDHLGPEPIMDACIHVIRFVPDRQRGESINIGVAGFADRKAIFDWLPDSDWIDIVHGEGTWTRIASIQRAFTNRAMRVSKDRMPEVNDFVFDQGLSIDLSPPMPATSTELEAWVLQAGKRFTGSGNHDHEAKTGDFLNHPRIRTRLVNIGRSLQPEESELGHADYIKSLIKSADPPHDDEVVSDFSNAIAELGDVFGYTALSQIRAPIFRRQLITERTKAVGGDSDSGSTNVRIVPRRKKIPVAEPLHEFVHTFHRKPVPGGWLIVIVYNSHSVGGPVICFYPDEKHEWDGSALPLPGFEVRQ